MDCRHFDEYISPYLDQMLGEQDRELFEKHFRGCSECRKNLEETRRMISIINGLDEEPLPQNFNDNLFNKLMDRRSFKSVYWLRWVGATAGVIILLFSIKVIKNTGLMDRATKDAYPPQEIAEDMDNTSDMRSQGQVENQSAPSESLVTMDKGEDRGKEEESTEALKDDSDGVADKAVDAHESSARTIKSDMVEVYVEDICITPQTLKFMAINNELDLVESDENSVVIELLNHEQRSTLYNELDKMGDVKEVGQNTGENKVRIVIMNKK